MAVALATMVKVKHGFASAEIKAVIVRGLLRNLRKPTRGADCDAADERSGQRSAVRPFPPTRLSSNDEWFRFTACVGELLS